MFGGIWLGTDAVMRDEYILPFTLKNYVRVVRIKAGCKFSSCDCSVHRELPIVVLHAFRLVGEHMHFSEKCSHELLPGTASTTFSRCMSLYIFPTKRNL